MFPDTSRVRATEVPEVDGTVLWWKLRPFSERLSLATRTVDKHRKRGGKTAKMEDTKTQKQQKKETKPNSAHSEKPVLRRLQTALQVAAKKRKHKVLSPPGKDELWRLIRCVCTVVPEKIINSHEDERPQLQSSCFYILKHAPSVWSHDDESISSFYSTVMFDFSIFILSLSYFIW